MIYSKMDAKNAIRAKTGMQKYKAFAYLHLLFDIFNYIIVKCFLRGRSLIEVKSRLKMGKIKYLIL